MDASEGRIDQFSRESDASDFPVKKLKLAVHDLHISSDSQGQNINEDESGACNGNLNRGADLVDLLDDGDHRHRSDRPQEAAFAINHIIESILEQLDRPNLLNCRLVCHRWTFFAAKELQKSVFLEFSQAWDVNEPLPTLLHKTKDLQLRPLNDLTDLLNAPNAFEFPCSYFRLQFQGPDSVISQQIQYFFNVYGYHLTKLHLFGFGNNYCNIGPGQASCDLGQGQCQGQCEGNGQDVTSMFGEDIRTLVLHQAPNLEHLVIRGNVDFKNWPISKLFENGPVNAGAQLKSTLKLKLRILEIYDEFPQNLFEEIVQFSPTLRKVQLKNENLHYLVKPVNRLHLLKKLEIHLNDKTRVLDSLEIVADAREINWALQELNVDGAFMVSYRPLWPRFAHVIYKILENCSSSLERLVWYQMGMLEGLCIPKLPKVTKIKLIFRYYKPHGFAQQFFPKKMRIAEKFPNLKSLFIAKIDSRDDIPSSIFKLFDNLDKVTSVTKVSSELLANETLLSSFREMFPNAKFSTNFEEFEFSGHVPGHCKFSRP